LIREHQNTVQLRLTSWHL